MPLVIRTILRDVQASFLLASVQMQALAVRLENKFDEGLGDDAVDIDFANPMTLCWSLAGLMGYTVRRSFFEARIARAVLRSIFSIASTWSDIFITCSGEYLHISAVVRLTNIKLILGLGHLAYDCMHTGYIGMGGIVVNTT